MKIKIFACIAFLSVLAGCVTQKRCNTKYPPSVDSIYKYVVKDSIILKDTTIYKNLPGETVIDSVKIPCPDPGSSYIPKKVHAETSLARADAWWDYPNIKLLLVQKDTTIEQRLKNALKEVYHWQNEYANITKKPEPVKYVPKFYKYCTLGFWGIIIVFFIWLFIKYKVKILSLIK